LKQIEINLKGYREHPEDLVEERTRELKQANDAMKTAKGSMRALLNAITESAVLWTCPEIAWPFSLKRLKDFRNRCMLIRLQDEERFRYAVRNSHGNVLFGMARPKRLRRRSDIRDGCDRGVYIVKKTLTVDSI